MIVKTPGPEVINACRVLFPETPPIDSDFLKSITSSDLKNTFRKRVMESHPDRHKALGQKRDDLNRVFHEVVDAYGVLKKAVNGVSAATVKVKQKKRAGSARPKKPLNSNKQPDSFRHSRFSGAMPHRRLKIGEFLYYTGKISWQSLIDAIIWQRQRRPRVGEIAIDWDILTNDEVVNIIRQKTYNKKFCEYALAEGFLTPFQHLAIVSRQKQLQPLFGEHFIERGFFSPSQLMAIAIRMRRHNIKMQSL